MGDSDANDRAGGQASSGDDLSGRLRGLDQALQKARRGSARGGDEEQTGSARSNARGMAQALKLSSEFVAGVAVGAGLGWFVDYLFGTSPWGLIVLLLLGFCAGVLNVLRGAGMVAPGGPPGDKS